MRSSYTTYVLQKSPFAMWPTGIRPFTRQRRLEMIQFMESRGVFQMKGAVDIVAEKLEMSRVTVYAYIDEVRKMSAD